jgi:hypothetical protein
VAAAQEVRDATGARRLSIVGLRLGGSIALAAASSLEPANLVLWDPVLDGRAYLAELGRLHEALTSDRRRYWFPTKRPRRSLGELVGFDLGEGLMRDIEGIRPPEALELGATRVCIVDSASSPELAALRRRLREHHVDVELSATTVAGGWGDDTLVEKLLLPADYVPRMTQFLEAGVA